MIYPSLTLLLQLDGSGKAGGVELKVVFLFSLNSRFRSLAVPLTSTRSSLLLHTSRVPKEVLVSC